MICYRVVDAERNGAIVFLLDKPTEEECPQGVETLDLTCLEHSKNEWPNGAAGPESCLGRGDRSDAPRAPPADLERRRRRRCGRGGQAPQSARRGRAGEHPRRPPLGRAAKGPKTTRTSLPCSSRPASSSRSSAKRRSISETAFMALTKGITA